jgi:hypothetical protein
MKLNQHLQLLLRKHYAPASMVNMRYKGNDVTFKTDDEGNPIVLFIGKRMESEKIKGERYVRVLKKDNTGFVIKDHWELKGKAS